MITKLRTDKQGIYYVALGIGLGLGRALVFELAALVASRGH